MKVVLSLILFFFSITIFAQTIQTKVDTNGIKLIDQQNIERFVLNAVSKNIEIQINDSLVLKIQGGATSSIKLLNNNTLVETGLEMDEDGAFAIGEFIVPPMAIFQFRQFVQSLRNGLYRPAPDTQSIATANQERLRITSNGFIGLATSDPTTRLDVNGRVRIRQIEPAPTPLLKTLVVDDFGILFTREPDNSFLLIKKQNKTIKELSARVALLEDKMRLLQN